MKKQDLYEYISSKIETVRANIKKEYYEILNPLVAREKAKVEQEYSEILPQALQLASAIEDFTEKYKIDIYYEHTRTIAYLRGSIPKKGVFDLIEGTLDRIQRSNDKTLLQWLTEEEIIMLRKAKEKQTFEYKKVEQLEQDLTNIVKQSSSAKLAYKNLEAVGLDMADFKVNKNLLPAHNLKPIVGIEILNSK